MRTFNCVIKLEDWELLTIVKTKDVEQKRRLAEMLVKDKLLSMVDSTTLHIIGIMNGVDDGFFDDAD